MKTTNKTTGKASKKQNSKQNVKDHTENDFTDCGTLIFNVAGKRIVLDKNMQREVFEFVMALNDRNESDKEKSDEIKVREFVSANLRNYVYQMPLSLVLKLTRIILKNYEMSEMYN